MPPQGSLDQDKTWIAGMERHDLPCFSEYWPVIRRQETLRIINRRRGAGTRGMDDRRIPTRHRIFM